MNKIKWVFSGFLLLSIMVGCEKSGSGSSNEIPSNLEVTTNISTDGSGNVAFTATATNAVNFGFEFGDGTNATEPSGKATHQYTLAGTNTFTAVVTAVGSTGQSIKKSLQVTVNVIPSAPGLIFADEFNTAGLPDASKWGYDIGAGGWGNAELQYYTNRSDNATVSGGTLKITAKKENFSGAAYTSARLKSQGKFDFKYGRVEVRAKLPAGAGSWPAIWSLGANIGTVVWPACGEIDIMEQKGSDPNRIHGTLHYPGRSGGNADGGTRVITNATTEFHIYELQWSATLIRILVDGQLVHTVANNSSIPFNQNFFLIMNVAIGGTFGGAVDPALNSAVMEVDYIRVYSQ